MDTFGFGGQRELKGRIFLNTSTDPSVDPPKQAVLDFATEGYAAGAPINDTSKMQVYLTMTRDSDGLPITITLAGNPTVAYRIPFNVHPTNTEWFQLYHNGPVVEKNIVVNCLVEAFRPMGEDQQSFDWKEVYR